MSKNNASGDVALLIDWENIKKSLQDEELKPNISAIRETAERYGRLVIARAYADWPDPWHRRDPGRLHNAGIEPIYVPTKSSVRRGARPERSHNSVDVKLTADCIEIIHRYPMIQTIVLVSGDADFIHAINLVRPYGRRVVAIGVSWSSATSLMETVDEFIEYDKEIIQADPGGTPVTGEQKHDLDQALNLIPEIVARSRFPGRAITKWVRRELVKKLDRFNERDFGFDTFRQFLQLAESQQLIELVTTEDMVEWVHLPDAPKVPAGSPLPADILPVMIRFALQAEQRYNYVTFNFLLNRMMEAKLSPHTRSQLAGILSDAINDELFLRGQHQRTNGEGKTQDVRTIELNMTHPAVLAAISEDEKLTDLLQELENQPDSPDQHRHIALRYADLGQWDLALEYQERAVKLAPEQLDLRLQRVALLCRAGRVEQAIDIGRSLAEANRTNPHPLAALAQIYEKRGNFRTAVPYYRQALAMTPSEETDLRLELTLSMVRCLKQQGATDKARDLCQAAFDWAGDTAELQAIQQELDDSLTGKSSIVDLQARDPVPDKEVA